MSDKPDFTDPAVRARLRKLSNAETGRYMHAALDAIERQAAIIDRLRKTVHELAEYCVSNTCPSGEGATMSIPDFTNKATRDRLRKICEAEITARQTGTMMEYTHGNWRFHDAWSSETAKAALDLIERQQATIANLVKRLNEIDETMKAWHRAFNEAERRAGLHSLACVPDSAFPLHEWIEQAFRAAKQPVPTPDRNYCPPPVECRNGMEDGREAKEAGDGA